MRSSCCQHGASALGFGLFWRSGLVPLALLILLVATGAAIAQGAPKSKLPNGYKLNLLIRATIIAVNQANQTGNYTVLRELSSPNFQKGNSKEKLAKIFAGLRKRNLDLSPIMFFDPKLLAPPNIDAKGMLRLTGFIPTKPQQVIFDLAYESVKGKWRLFGIAIDVRHPGKPKRKRGTKPKATVARDKPKAAIAQDKPEATVARDKPAAARIDLPLRKPKVPPGAR